MDKQTVFESVEFLPNQDVFKQGDTGDAMYLINRGGIRIWTEQNGIPVTLANLPAGAIFGEMALIKDLPRVANATAGERGCSAVKISKPAFQQRIDRSDPMIMSITKLLIEHLKAANMRIIALSQKLKNHPVDGNEDASELQKRCKALEDMVVKLKAERQQLLARIEGKNTFE